MSETTPQTKRDPMDATTMVRAVEVFVLERMVDGVEDSTTQTNKRVSVVLTVDHASGTASVTPMRRLVPTEQGVDQAPDEDAHESPDGTPSIFGDPLRFNLNEGGFDELNEWEALGVLITRASQEGAARLRTQRALSEAGKPNKELY